MKVIPAHWDCHYYTSANFLLAVWSSWTREREQRSIELKRHDGRMNQPQSETEDIALSRWEWTTLWQPVSKWQNPSFHIDQLFFCLSAVIFRPSLPLFILSSRHHNPLPAAPYWSSLVIGWTVIWDGHWWMSANCFSFSLLHSSRGWWSHNPRHRARQGQIAMECRLE